MNHLHLLRNAILLPFVFILVASLGAGMGMQPSYATVIGDGGTIGTKHRVTVKFDNMTVHSDHDRLGLPPTPAVCCSGEWYLSAYVQGKLIDLLRDRSVDDDDTITFPPGSEITVEFPNNNPPPLSIFTIGFEDDTGFFTQCTWHGIPIPGFGCGFCGTDLGNTTEIAQILRGEPSTWSEAIHNYQMERSNCDINGVLHERLGLINKIYNATSWGEGVHSNVVSSNGDFTLRYTITVTHPPELERGTGTGGVCDKPMIAPRGVTASSSQNPTTFPATKVIDGDLNTKWISQNSLNPFITLELPGNTVSTLRKNLICGVEIAWADGNVHPYKFDVSVSNDTSNFINVLSAKSKVTSGSTPVLETYSFPQPIRGNFVKVTITESTADSTNSIAQISELRALGSFSTIILHEEEEGCGDLPVCP